MSLRRRLTIALGVFCSGAVFFTIHAQEPAQGPALFTSETRIKDNGVLTRTGARRTAVVAAVDRVKAATVNIHSERNVASASTDGFGLAAPRAMNGMGTGIIIDPRGYIVTNQHVVDDV